jgi:histidinol-phosphate aminotransferase
MTARIHGHQVVEVPLDEDWDLKLDSTKKAVDYARPSLLFIASPNNPTGTMVSEDRLRALIEHARDALVVIDEAYVDYASRQQLQLLQEYDNVLILRTLSKVGFASLRLGWLLGNSELVREVDKVRLPYNIPTPSQLLGTRIIAEHGDELEGIRRYVVRERERVSSAMRELEGVAVAPSEANFVWFKTERPAEEVYQALQARGILVPSFHKHGGRLKQYLRATIGLEHENTELLAALEAIV